MPRHVMTVGSSRPVNSRTRAMSRARATRGCSASAVSISSASTSSADWYFSMYMRTVAPTEPVPERRKMIREPSAKRRRTCARRARVRARRAGGVAERGQCGQRWPRGRYAWDGEVA
eukprot:7388577-Prymnesium_polylepis.2